MQSQFGGLNLGTNSFTGNMVPAQQQPAPPAGGGLFGGGGGGLGFPQTQPPPQMPLAFNSTPAAKPAAAATGSQDILGLWQ